MTFFSLARHGGCSLGIPAAQTRRLERTLRFRTTTGVRRCLEVKSHRDEDVQNCSPPGFPSVPSDRGVTLPVPSEKPHFVSQSIAPFHKWNENEPPISSYNGEARFWFGWFNVFTPSIVMEMFPLTERLTRERVTRKFQDSLVIFFLRESPAECSSNHRWTPRRMQQRGNQSTPNDI